MKLQSIMMFLGLLGSTFVVAARDLRAGDIIQIKKLGKNLRYEYESTGPAVRVDKTKLVVDSHAALDVTVRSNNDVILPNRADVKKFEKSQWLVVSAKMGGGQHPPEVNEINYDVPPFPNQPNYPNGLQILARRLDGNGALDADAITLEFSQRSFFSTDISKGIKIVSEDSPLVHRCETSLENE